MSAAPAMSASAARSALAAVLALNPDVVPFRLFAAAVRQALDRDDLFAVRRAEDGHALAGAADDADLVDRSADHLPARGHQQQVVALLDREGGREPITRPSTQAVGRQPLPAPTGAAILIGRRPLADTGLGAGQEELRGSG